MMDWITQILGQADKISKKSFAAGTDSPASSWKGACLRVNVAPKGEGAYSRGMKGKPMRDHSQR